MPIHDWTRVDAGIFHAFHHGWIEELARALNRGVLPNEHYALPAPDWVGAVSGRLLIPWGVTVHRQADDRPVAAIHIVLPDEKASRTELVEFAKRASMFLAIGIHLLVVDIAAATASYVLCFHDEVWRRVAGERYCAPPDKPLTLAAYTAGNPVEARVEPVAVADVLGDMPLFLSREVYVSTPLEATYAAAFVEVPRRWRRVLDSAIQ
jgi:hypothetical protein